MLACDATVTTRCNRVLVRHGGTEARLPSTSVLLLLLTLCKRRTLMPPSRLTLSKLLKQAKKLSADDEDAPPSVSEVGAFEKREELELVAAGEPAISLKAGDRWVKPF